MLDLGWSEILVIGVVALIVVGPKDLPRMLRTLGQYTAKAKGIAREFQRSMEEAARQADIDELKDVKKDLDDMREDHYKMQREMSQSFLDKPEKKKKKKAPKAVEAAGDGAAASAPDPAPQPTPEPETSAEAAPEPPKAASGSAGGA